VQDDQTVRLAFQVDTSSLPVARTRAQELEREIKDLKDAMDRGTVSGSFYQAEMRKLETAYRRAGAAADDASGRSGRGGVAGFGNAMLTAGRMVDDFSAAGLRGIVNNFESMAMALGLGGGVAGVVTIAAVAMNLLLPRLKEMGGIGEVVKSRMGELAAEIEKLDGKKIKLEADTTALDGMKAELKLLQEAAENFKATISGQNKYESASGRAVGEAIVESEQGQEALAATRASVVSGVTSGFDQDIAGKKTRLAQLRAEQAKLNPNEQNTARARELRGEINSLEADLGVLTGARDVTAANAGSTFDQVLLQAQKSTGIEQTSAQMTLAATLEKFGATGAGDLAGRIRGAAPATFVAKERDKQFTESLMKEGAANEAAAMMQLERAKREKEEAAELADAEFERVTGKAETSGKALTEQREQRERQKQAKLEQEQQALAAQQQALAEQQQVFAVNNDRRDLTAQGQALAQQIARAQMMGATQLQLQEAFGRDVEQINRGWVELEQRTRALELRRQQVNLSHQRRRGR
jgi:hypothetical protein